MGVRREQELFPGWLFLILLAAACITACRNKQTTITP